MVREGRAQVPRDNIRSEPTRAALRQAALDVASEYGVKGVTHRRVAAAASVALGSASYHYENIDELMFEAFAAWVQTQSDRFMPPFRTAVDEDTLVAAVLHLLSVMYGDEKDRILLFEIYAHSVRDPAYHKLVENWSASTRSELARLYSSETAQRLEAAWEGIGVQLVMGGSVKSAGDAEPLFRLILSQEKPKADKRKNGSKKAAKAG
jgi:TetR/AcrR family transcriptional regulator, regulator of biofilm formation and stress response